MKKLAALILVVLWSACAAVASEPFQNEKEAKTFTVAKGGSFELDTRLGTVLLSVWDKSEASVTVENMNAADRQHLSMTTAGNSIKVSFLPTEQRSHNNVKFTIIVPSEFNIDLSTGGGTVQAATGQSITGRVRVHTGGGAVDIGDVNGDLNVDTGGGNIAAGSIAANANLSTGGGQIRCGFVRGNANVRTGGGNVVLQGAARELDVSTGGGSITVEDGGINTVAETGGGNLALNKLSGKTSMKTGGGSISIRNASGVLSASTGGGNLTFNNVTGSIRARTGAGSIYAEMSPDGQETSLSSGSGSIDLGLHASARATVVARVKSNVSFPGSKADITSDFGSPEEGESNHERTFLINGGGPKIYIETNVGKIRIRKLE